MKIGIIGAGQVGSRLGKAWAAHGHEIMFSSRTPESEKMQSLVAAAGANTQAGTVQETLAFGEIIVMALHWDVLESVVTTTPGDWKNKIMIDVTNRFIPAPPDTAGSAAQDLARLTGANVVKAFNHIGAEHMQFSEFPDGPASILICGDDNKAKATVRELVAQLGFEVFDMGWLREAHHLEALAKVWIHAAFNTDLGRNIAFRLIRK